MISNSNAEYMYIIYIYIFVQKIYRKLSGYNLNTYEMTLCMTYCASGSLTSRGIQHREWRRRLHCEDLGGLSLPRRQATDGLRHL